ncbi:hypothetical protein D9C73_000450 [Collichthys lucidus]|uniref:Uncharacterized protein n=1 Tax=Collichthys lucidus TaxID=240159 RepID=A0A4U5TXJ9_COLLU|nr:hypothetical protein D9C73_000450 [Collichthys lucidus]
MTSRDSASRCASSSPRWTGRSVDEYLELMPGEELLVLSRWSTTNGTIGRVLKEFGVELVCLHEDPHRNVCQEMDVWCVNTNHVHHLMAQKKEEVDIGAVIVQEVVPVLDGDTEERGPSIEPFPPPWIWLRAATSAWELTDMTHGSGRHTNEAENTFTVTL